MADDSSNVDQSNCPITKTDRRRVSKTVKILSTPLSIPAPPSPLSQRDQQWVKAQMKQGDIPPPIPPMMPSPVLEGSKRPRVAPSNLSTVPRVLRAIEVVDEKLTKEDWEKTYEAYGKTGVMKDLISATGLQSKQVKHLLTHGVTRLGLPPIPEHATDQAKVSLAATSNASSDNFMLNLPNVQEAITNRAAKEATAAQGLLSTAIHNADLLLGYTTQLVKKLSQEGEEAYALPDKITPSLISELTKSISGMAKAVDVAIQVSRRTAGEPEKHISMEIAFRVGQMTSEERTMYADTGKLPPRLITGKAPPSKAAIDVDFTGSNDE